MKIVMNASHCVVVKFLRMAWMVTIHCNAETSTVNIYGTKVVKSTTKSSIKSRQRIAKTICHTQKKQPVTMQYGATGKKKNKSCQCRLAHTKTTNKLQLSISPFLTLILVLTTSIQVII